MEYNVNYQTKDNNYFNHERKELLHFVDKNARKILDVGCGTGEFGNMLKRERNMIVWGIEPDIESAEKATKKLDVVINALFNDNVQEIKNEKFDIIFFNDVLEHLENPEYALKLCKDSLYDDGKIIASIPNIRWYPVVLSLLRYKDFCYQQSGVMDKTHLRFYTVKSMKRLFTEAGYHVIKTEGINPNKNFRIFNIINALLLGSQSDMKYPQYVVIARL